MVKIKSSESFSFDNCQEKNLEYIRVSSYEQKRKFSWCQMSYIEQSKCPCTTAPSIERSLVWSGWWSEPEPYKKNTSRFDEILGSIHPERLGLKVQKIQSAVSKKVE